ncbi:MarR family winged helix-turn-helix transcriptional regulator [Mycobacterium sp. BMJ-28]
MTSTLPEHGMTTSVTATLLRATRRLTARLDAELQESGLGVDHWLALEALAAAAGLTMAELQALTLTAGPTLTRVVDRLVGQALAYREVDQFDRRKVRVFLSERGTSLHDELRRQIEPVEAQWAAANRRQLSDRLGSPPRNA